MAEIRVENLLKSYKQGSRRVEALRGIDLVFNGGEPVAVIGPSGAGKTTLIHILGTIDRPSAGRVLYDGRDVFAMSDRDLARFRNRTVGFVFQFHHLLLEFTALENTMMPALIQGVQRREAKGRAQEILEEVGLGDRMTHKPGELSGGEQQRVAVARSLILEPQVLLADEPTGNLDRETGEGVYQLLQQMNREKGITLIIVTHNEEIAGRLPRRIHLVDGRVV
ncbi:MAG: ATP-binding cassette domain-containing protein [Proteobacteria bacterium]|nr:ATP-binding cassette domain-containing protein [Pseudomonadota bacterium]NIS67806.1 ATP-binding cassette domain-containing protein [Pseudomonadota bacterium]